MSETQYREGERPADGVIMVNMMGFEDADGDTLPVSPTNPLPVTGSFSITGGATEAKQSSAIEVMEVSAAPANRGHLSLLGVS